VISMNRGVDNLVSYFQTEAISFISLLEQSKTGVRRANRGTVPG